MGPEDYSPAEYDRFDALWLAKPEDGAWILSDRDVWYANPAYTGPPVPHPEDEDTWVAICEGGMTLEEYAAEVHEDAEVRKAAAEAAAAALVPEDDIPF
jgi:hypothetical protein